MEHNFGMINYHGVNFKFTVWGIDYIPPYFHRELELWALLHGRIAANIDGNYVELQKGDFCIIDSFKIHELKSASEDEIPILMVMHINADFFKAYYPVMTELVFPFQIYNRSTMEEGQYRALLRGFLAMGIAYFKKEAHYELQVAGLINLFFARMLTCVSFESISEESRQALIVKTQRLKRLADYINEHYDEKLLLSDLAEQEAISMSRLSHLFKECFGKSFQDYLMRVRCEQAKELLRASDMSLLDISMDCGFSDPKYFNQGFRKIYGMTPKEYRKTHKNKENTTRGQHTDVLVKSGSFLTDEDCYLILEYCMGEVLKLNEE